jgi:hypothetical protein
MLASTDDDRRSELVMEDRLTIELDALSGCSFLYSLYSVSLISCLSSKAFTCFSFDLTSVACLKLALGTLQLMFLVRTARIPELEFAR